MQYYPISYQQKKLYLYSKVHNDDVEYNVVVGMEFHKEINEQKIENTVYQLLEEEPILRCKITEKNNCPVQYAADIEKNIIKYYNISDDETEDISNRS